MMRLRLAAILLAFLQPIVAEAITVDIEPVTGLLQVPSSQYYLWTYGLRTQVATNKRTLILSLVYVERPKYEAQGFSDQDRAFLVLGGAKVYEFTKSLTVETQLGVGRILGYISSSHPEYPTRQYHLSGPAFDLTLSWQFAKRIRASLSHQMLVGLNGREDLSEDLAWPFLFFQFGIGYQL